MSRVQVHSDETVVSTPGKVLITGGYLVLDPSNSGLVLTVSARFYSRVSSYISSSDFLKQNSSIPQNLHTLLDEPTTPHVLRIMVFSPQISLEPSFYTLDLWAPFKITCVMYVLC